MSYRVLIVDDSKLARMSVGKLLRTLRPDWQCVEVSDSDGALAMARDGKVDLALVDFNMPGRDGLAVAADLRDLKKGMPVAIVSANHQTEVIGRANELGAKFLGKPLTSDTLEKFLAAVEPQLKGNRE